MAKLPQTIVLAIDAMGGDRAPAMVIEGMSLAARTDSNLRFQVFGNKEQLDPLLKKYSHLASVAEIIHTPDVIKSDDKPAVALRQGRNSSMRLAVDAVAKKRAQGVVSAGNTGAYMAIAKIFLKMIEGIERPAFVASFPTAKGACVMLDLGANVQCAASHLVQFAIMGNAYAKEVLGVKSPKIGLLNVGEEEQKGHPMLQEAANVLRRAKKTLNYYGFVEGDDIAKGTVDVIVTDGFTGNVTLKTIEGMVTFIMSMLKDVFQSSWLARIGYLLSMSAFGGIRTKMNPKKYNGAMLIGLGGVAIKSHGGADAFAFSNAIHVAARFISHDLNQQIRNSVIQMEKDLKKNPETDIPS